MYDRLKQRFFMQKCTVDDLMNYARTKIMSYNLSANDYFESDYMKSTEAM